MPNWCKNNLRIVSNGQKVLEILEMLKDEKGRMTFMKVAPQPEELRNTISPVPDDVPIKERERLREKYGADNWYEWNIKNWGCKWDASDSVFYEKDGYNMVTFTTAWDPPIEFLEKLSSMFPNTTFIMQYAEESLYVGAIEMKNGNSWRRDFVEYDGAEAAEKIWGEEWVEVKKGE